MKQDDEKKTILVDNEYSKIELENGIIIATWKCSVITLEIAKIVVDERLKITAHNKYPFLIHMKSVKESTKEARDFLATGQACLDISVAAFYVDSILENVIANLFIYLNKPTVPTKIFRDVAKAREWLEKHKEKK